MYYRDRVGSIYSHAGFVSRINVQVGTVVVTSLFSSLFYDCYRQPITTPYVTKYHDLFAFHGSTLLICISMKSGTCLGEVRAIL